MSTITATISGTPVSVKNGAYMVSQALETRGQFQFTVVDTAGTASYTRGQPVVLTDSVSGTIFKGFIQSSTPEKLGPATTTIEHEITCIDKRYLLDKRANTKNYTNQYAGDIISDMIDSTLSAEGVTASYAMRRDTTAAQFNKSILSGTAGAGTGEDGYLELTKAGSDLTITEATTSDFSTGTLTNVTAANNTLSPTPFSAIRLVSNLPLTVVNSAVSVLIWSGSMTVGTLDSLNYGIWIASTSSQQTACVDLLFSDGTRLSTASAYDQEGMSTLPTTDLTGYATDQWYNRVVSFPSALNGKTINKVVLTIAGTATGEYTMYFKNIYLGSQSGSPFFSTSATATQATPTITSAVGYSLPQTRASVVTAFDPGACSRISPAYSIDAVKLLQSSTITWVASAAGDTDSLVSASYDGTSYQPCTNNAALPALPVGSNVAGISLRLKQTFTAGDDPTIIPRLADVRVSLLSAANATKSDIVTSFATQSAWNTGTHSSTQALANGDLTVGVISPAWTSISNQTFFQFGGVTQSASGGVYTMNLPDNDTFNWFYGVSRLDFAGLVSDFTLDVDVLFTPLALSTGQYYLRVGVLYRTTTWNATDNTWGYLVMIDGGHIELGHGSNSESGSYTTLQSVTQSFSANTYYHLTIVVRGNHHQVFIDNESTATINVVDDTYMDPGNIGLRSLSGYAGGATTARWKEFDLNPANSGTWTGPSTSVSSLGTCGDSVISWTEENGSNASSSIQVLTSINSGSSYQVCTSGSQIPGLTSGTSLSGKSVIVQVKLTALSEPFAPIIRQLVWRVLGAYPGSSGTRSTVPSGNDTMVRSDVVGSWGTSFDSQSYTKTGTGTTNLASNKGVITNTTGDVHMRLGSRTATDTDGDVRFSLSASSMQAGMELRYTDANNFYRFATSGTSAYIQKVSGGSGTVLQSTSVSLSTGVSYRMRFRVTGSSTTSLSGSLWQDGQTEPTSWLLTATDASSPLLSGGFALFGSGTGTTSFDRFRVTQYPDPALALDAMNTRVGSTLVSWNQIVPTNATLGIDTSRDGVNWTDVSGSNGGSIPGITSQPSPSLDGFDTNTSASYTSGSLGGSNGTWTWDTANSRLTGTGGTNATLVYNPLTGVSSGYVEIDLDIADDCGCITNFVDANTCYFVRVWDASGTSQQNKMQLFRRSGGTSTQVGGTASIAFTRNTPHKVRLDNQSGVLTVTFDSVTAITHTDGSPLAAGKFGLLENSSAGGRFYQVRMQQYGDSASGYVYTRARLATTDASAMPRLSDLTTSVRGSTLASGTLIPQLHDLGKPFATFFSDELKSLVESSGDYYWNIDNEGVLTFRQRTASPAPWCLHSSDLLYEPTVTPVFSADLYRNRQIITNCIGVTSEQYEQKLADGSESSWNMAYPLYSAPTIKVEGVEKTVGVQGVDTGKDFYWAKGETSIGQDEDAEKLTEGYLIEFWYVGQYETSVTRDNLAEQAARALVETGTSGIVEAIEDGNGMLASAAETYADGLLARYSRNDAVQLEAATQRSGLFPGQILPVFIPEHGLFDRQPLITKVDTEAEQKVDGNVLYTYKITATDGANLTDWTSVFFG